MATKIVPDPKTVQGLILHIEEWYEPIRSRTNEWQALHMGGGLPSAHCPLPICPPPACPSAYLPTCLPARTDPLQLRARSGLDLFVQ